MSDEISIHAPRTGSDLLFVRQTGFIHISIHAPRTGSDSEKKRAEWLNEFQSTLPARGATATAVATVLPSTLFQSTLPARGATQTTRKCATVRSYFNPRSPHGERPYARYKRIQQRQISIHAPRTGSDGHYTAAGGFPRISIHAPRTGSDTINLSPVSTGVISIHAPRTGSDCRCR